MRKLWGGAFNKESQELADAFGQSIESDLTFWEEDVTASMAHAHMLGRTGILASEDVERIIGGLQQILNEGPDRLPKDVEDIHTAVEVRLGELIGDAAKRLHTARSRNDQVATDTRLWLRHATTDTLQLIKELQKALLAQAESHRDTILPGQTHQQHAQPISLSFWLMAHFWAMQRHGWRLQTLAQTGGSCPLGSAALAGTSYPLNRRFVADELGFRAETPNALDATSDRSYIMDAVHSCTLVMIDLSRMSQELILWAAPEHGFVRLDDSLTTGSSIMPQKRNPDMAELIRGRTGRVIGHWTGLAAMMKGLILGYNRDTQEDKPPLFDAMNTARQSLQLMRAMIESADFNAESMAEACRRDFSTATDLADLLAAKGMPFREAHEVVGKVVRHCQSAGIGLEDLTLADAQGICKEIDQAMLDRLDPRASMESRNVSGGTGPDAVKKQMDRAGQLIEAEGFTEIW